MDAEFKMRFIEDWKRYFPGAELPMGFCYSRTADPKLLAGIPKGHRCVMADLAKVRKGKVVSFSVQTIGCGGGTRYFGFSREVAPNFDYFLSCGIPGKLEGERYKKSPELVREFMKQGQPLKAPGDYITFKRWDRLEEGDNPPVVIFFSPPDVISGLFTLANFDEVQSEAVIAPFGAGCASIVDYPRRELASPAPRAVIGMFDVSARPCMPADVLSFAVPWPKFVRMVDNMPESFLITRSWNKVRTRMKREQECKPQA